ncbi:hypothetical protein [Brochothrix thermosphacta]|uniref:hypothetical protein n=1 Tax=Brochothrix thermosphacta TaxID=2756 RepID=UPI00083F858E|nr:hypothetical protein [Brochothrix thermosphacta]ODJ63096.1 hypothetical protein BFR35_09510 [Brochothrix thermosphacta]ODJ66064.1 hypothetical protein BFR37_09845 [Brochothrix thermosphacta]SPN72598.1 protein of unknown function [Brochothrix thermosphacta]
MDKTMNQLLISLLFVCIGSVLGIIIFLIGSGELNIVMLLTLIFITSVSFVIFRYILKTYIKDGENKKKPLL